MEIPSELISIFGTASVALITAYTTNEYWKRRITKLEYFKNRFGPFYHVLIDTWDSLKFIHDWIEKKFKWDDETIYDWIEKKFKWDDKTIWQHLFRFHSYQWTLKTDHLPDLKYLVKEKMLIGTKMNELIRIMDLFDILFHLYLSPQKRLPEEGYVKGEEFHYGKVFIRQIEIPDVDSEKIEKLETELKGQKKDIAGAIQILKQVIDELAKKI